MKQGNNKNTNHAAKYQVMEEVGKGMFGSVRKAVCNETGQLLAMKDMKLQQFREKPKLLELLRSEISTLKSTKHPNLIELVDSFSNSTSQVLVYEFCDGGTLKHYLKENSYNENEILCYILQILYAIQCLHNKNILHRDIKPDNVLFKSDKREWIKVADLGFCTAKGQHYDNSVIGSPGFIAPEIFLQKLYSKKSDIYAIGILLYEIIFKQLPFTQRNQVELAAFKARWFPRKEDMPQHCSRFMYKVLGHMVHPNFNKRADCEKLILGIEKQLGQFGAEYLHIAQNAAQIHHQRQKHGISLSESRWNIERETDYLQNETFIEDNNTPVDPAHLQTLQNFGNSIPTQEPLYQGDGAGRRGLSPPPGNYSHQQQNQGTNYQAFPQDFQQDNSQFVIPGNYYQNAKPMYQQQVPTLSLQQSTHQQLFNQRRNPNNAQMYYPQQQYAYQQPQHQWVESVAYQQQPQMYQPTQNGFLRGNGNKNGERMNTAGDASEFNEHVEDVRVKEPNSFPKTTNQLRNHAPEKPPLQVRRNDQPKSESRSRGEKLEVEQGTHDEVKEENKGFFDFLLFKPFVAQKENKDRSLTPGKKISPTPSNPSAKKIPRREAALITDKHSIEEPITRPNKISTELRHREGFKAQNYVDPYQQRRNDYHRARTFAMGDDNNIRLAPNANPEQDVVQNNFVGQQKHNLMSYYSYYNSGMNGDYTHTQAPNQNYRNIPNPQASHKGELRRGRSIFGDD